MAIPTEVFRGRMYGLPAVFLVAAHLLSPLPASAEKPQPVTSYLGMAVSEQELATRAAFEVIEAGGNAADAAVALGFALAVTYPAAGNLGGGGFLVYRSPEGEVSTLDFRETAPATAGADMFIVPGGKPDPELSRRSLLASGVPGSVAGLLETLERFGSGRFTRRELLAPAISLAEEGFPVYPMLAEDLRARQDRLASIPSTRRVFYPGGQPPEAGDTLRIPGLARVLRDIAERGRDGFYRGAAADSIASFMARGGGLVTRADLAGYRVVGREPVVIDYSGYRLYCMGPPSSGGVVLGQVLGLLEPFGLEALGHNTPAYVNRVVEAERLAYADRNHFLGDPSFVEIPLRGLLAAGYLDSRRGLMPEGRAGSSERTGHGLPDESLQTTNFCVADRYGGAAVITTTLNGSYGNGYVVPGCGFLLNNEMDDFTAAPGEPNMFGLVQGRANMIEPGKRMLSSMTPTIVTRPCDCETPDEESLFMLAGAAGGPRIITAVLQVLLNSMHFGMNVREAVAAGRFHHQHLPDSLYTEPGAFGDEAAAALRAMGYRLSEKDHLGNATAVRVREDGTFAGWGDGGAGEGKQD